MKQFIIYNIFFCFCISNTLHAQNCNIHLTIIDSSASKPLDFASIQVLDSSGVIDQGMSDSNGKYTIQCLSNYFISISVSYIGYASVNYVLNGIETDSLVVYLEETGYIIDDLLIESPDGDIIFRRPGCPQPFPIKTMAVRYFLPHGKIPYIVHSYCSYVHSSDNGEDGILNIAGSRADATKYFIDGVTVIGALEIPMETVMSIEVIYSGIPVQYGDVTGGVIEVTTKGVF